MTCWGITKSRSCGREVAGWWPFCGDHKLFPLFALVAAAPLVLASIALIQSDQAHDRAVSANNTASQANQISMEANNIANEALQQAQKEDIVVRVTGAGLRDQNYQTRFVERKNADGDIDHVLMETIWAIAFTNNRDNTVSLVDHRTAMVKITPAGREERPVQTIFVDRDLKQQPVVVGPGASETLLLRVPLRVGNAAYARASASGSFSGHFLLSDLERFLAIDGGLLVDDGVSATNGVSNMRMVWVPPWEEGHLTIEVATSRGNRFAGNSDYYNSSDRRPEATRVQGGGLILKFPSTEMFGDRLSD